MHQKFLLIIFFCCCGITVFSQSIEAYKNIWQGKIFMHLPSDIDTSFDYYLDFFKVDGNTLNGLLRLKDRIVKSGSLKNKTFSIQAFYSDVDSSVFCEYVLDSPDDSLICKGKLVLQIANNILKGIFTPDNKECITAEIVLSKD